MSELSTKSRLAITERKNNGEKQGGFVGIFFQLFDWNRKFSKNKILPKKLLLPAGAKVSKKFNADEKLPVGKHLQISVGENNGGFSTNVKKNVTSEMKKQQERQVSGFGLVARLMGLEALPTSNVGCRKDDRKGRGDGLGVGGGGGSSKASLSPEKGNLRPQKIQKIDVFEKRPVTNVLSRSKKANHPKVASPVKSMKSGNNMSRLIDTAARVLEPGVQASSQARSSLTYSNSVVRPAKEDVMTEEKVMDMDLQCQSSSKFCTAHASCRSCGNFLERLDMRSVGEEKAAMFDMPVSNFRESFLRSLEERRPRPKVYLENETEVVLLKTRYQPDYVTNKAVESRPVRSDKVRNVVHPSGYHNQILASRTFTSQKDRSPSLDLKQGNQRRSPMSIRDGVPPRAKPMNTHVRRVPSAGSVSEIQDFVTLNRSIKSEQDRTFCIGKNVSQVTSKTPVRRRNLNLSRSVDTIDSRGSLCENQRSNKSNAMAQNGPRIRSNSVNQTNIKSRPVSPRGKRETDVVSFTFSSPVKTKDRVGQLCDDKLQDKMMTVENCMKRSSQNSFQMKGDAIGALLEQKLKELTHQVETEATSGFTPSARTTASILQELISALTAEKPMSYEEEVLDPGPSDSLYGEDSVEGISQFKSRDKRFSDNLSCEVDYFSPDCILDASFSNESCISSSIDDNSGSVQPACTDVEILDSASSTNKIRSNDLIPVTDLLNHAFSQIQNVDLVHSKLSGTKLSYVLEIIINAELLFGNAARHSSFSFVDFLLGPFLDELETLVIAAWKNSIIVGIEIKKEESPLRRFLFDCIVECLDVRYFRFSSSGYRACSRIPKCMDTDILVKVFDEEVRKWTAFDGKTPDEIIEKDMSTSLGKWTDFEIETFETASQINEGLVQTLVDEIVIDLIGSELNFC